MLTWDLLLCLLQFWDLWHLLFEFGWLKCFHSYLIKLVQWFYGKIVLLMPVVSRLSCWKGKGKFSGSQVLPTNATSTKILFAIWLSGRIGWSQQLHTEAFNWSKLLKTNLSKKFILQDWEICWTHLSLLGTIIWFSHTTRFAVWNDNNGILFQVEVDLDQIAAWRDHILTVSYNTGYCFQLWNTSCTWASQKSSIPTPGTIFDSLGRVLADYGFVEVWNSCERLLVELGHII